MRARAGRLDLAVAYYSAGWDGHGGEAVACGQRLLDHFAVAGDWPEVGRLVDEADEWLGPRVNRPAEAGRFYSVVAETADRGPDDVRAELRDRARLALAGHLQAGAVAGRPGAAVGQLFGREDVWPPPVVRD